MIAMYFLNCALKWRNYDQKSDSAAGDANTVSVE